MRGSHISVVKIQVLWDMTQSAWWATLKWVGAFIFKVQHSQKNDSFLDSVTLKRALWSFKPWEFLIQEYNVTSPTTWIFYTTTPFTSVLHYITMSKSCDKRQQTQIFINNTNHLVWTLSSTSTYSTQLDVTYAPSLDSFHILQSKGWDMHVDKVGS